MLMHADSTTSLEYWAGFFDGEGSVMLQTYQGKKDNQPRVRLKVTVTNTHLDIMKLLANDFPPNGEAFHTYDLPHGRRKMYVWTLHGQDAYMFLRVIRPHTIVKREQIELAIEFFEKPWRPQRNMFGRTTYTHRTADNLAIDLDYVRRIKELKHASSQ